MAMATHACSCAAWHPHSSLAGTRHSVAPPCCRDSAGSALCAGRTPLGPLHRCCRGTGRADNARRAAVGPHSTQGHTHHSGDLPAQSAGQCLGTWGPPRALSAVVGTHLCSQGCSGRRPAASGGPGSRRRQSGGGCQAPQGRGRAGSAAQSPGLGSQSARLRTCMQALSEGQGCWQHPALHQAHIPRTSGTSRRPCGHGSACSCPSGGRSPQHARCTGRAGTQGSPSGRAGSGRSASRGHPHDRSTAP